jgi:heme-degrading monooxygenase HmoA
MMHARVTTIQVDPERLDEMVARLEEEDLPTFRQIRGFRGFTLLVHRASGKVIGTSYWNSEEDMANSEEAVRPSRDRAVERGGADSPPDVERFEVALDSFVR